MYDPEASQIHYSDIFSTIGNGYPLNSTIGQSFVSRHHNLDSITVWLTGYGIKTDPKPYLHFILYQDLNKSTVLYRATYQLPTADFRGPFRISFPKITTNLNQNLLFELSASNGFVKVHGIWNDIFPDGTAYFNGEKATADLAFSTTYIFEWLDLVQDIRSVFQAILHLLPLFIVLLIPGWICIQMFRVNERLDFWGKIALSGGISLAIIPVIFLWTSVLGIHWSEKTALLFGSLLIFTCIWFWSQKTTRNLTFKINVSRTSILLSGIVLVSAVLRVSMVRDYFGPLWVDSVHHGLITRLIQEQGTLFINYQNYFDIPSTSYHPGYHANLALFQWFSGLQLPLAMLVFGQALNTMAVLSTYLLAKTLSRNSNTGIWAALAAGFLMPLPAYMTSWGRYTHLTGMIIFSSGVYLFSLLSDGLMHGNNSRKHVDKIWDSNIIQLSLVFSVCAVGLFLVHYRVAVFFAIWCLLAVILQLKKVKNNKQFLIFILVILILGLLISLPWLVPSIRDTFIPRLTYPTHQPALFADFDASILTSGYGGLVLILAGIGLTIHLFRNTSSAVLILGWAISLFFIANLAALGLPGGMFVNNISVEITIFPLMGFLFGYGVDQINQIITAYIGNPWKKIWALSVVIAGVILSILGTGKLVTIINPNTALARKSDLAAITWITENLPSDGRFLISPFTWGYGLCAGYDGGYYISSFAQNNTFPQPVLYGFGSEAQINFNKSICEQKSGFSKSSMDLWKFMRANNLNYVFLGTRGGIITPKLVSNTSFFEIIYRDKGTIIAKVI